MSIARDILALPCIDLPPLVAIITCPAFTAEGKLILADGYDTASGLWHHRTLVDLPPIAECPSLDEVASSRDVLLDIVAEFPFIDAGSRANTLAMMLLPFVRHMIEGPTPLHAFDAPTAGTGKSLLVQACLLPALGHSLDIRTGAREPDEWRKRITSELAFGKPAIGFDNTTLRLDSEHLSAVLTATMWTDRVLGQTRLITLPNRATWVCTGNNLTFSKELARRVVWIRLDAKIEIPEQRTGFRYPSLLQHICDHRTHLVAAALTLIRAWLAAGRPQGRQVMGSFENYAAILGGILDVAGVAGFLGNADELRRHADTETGEWRAFIHAWWARWQDNWVGVSDLAALLWTEDGHRSDLLVGVVRSDRERGAVTQLGRRLSAKRDCVIGDWRIVVHERPDKCGRLQYRLIPRQEADLGQTSGRLVSEVCPEVCRHNPCDDNGLDAPADLGILSSQSYACGRARGRAHARTREDDLAEKSAEVCPSLQIQHSQRLAPADLPADLRQTSALSFPKSANRASPAEHERHPAASPACDAGAAHSTSDQQEREAIQAVEMEAESEAIGVPIGSPPDWYENYVAENTEVHDEH